MKNIKALILLLGLNLIISSGFAKTSNSWDDYMQDAIQINSPIEFIDKYNKYTVISPKKKIRLTDFGNIEKNKNGVKYTLKKYGVQILNNNKVYNVFKTTTTLKSDVDFALLYNYKNIVAFRVREFSTIDYIKSPYSTSEVTTYIYNFDSNNFSKITVLLSDSDLYGGDVDLLTGDQFTFNSKKGIYTYLANIKYAKNGKIGTFKVDLNNSLKCISATLGCENVGLSSAELDSASK
ncbi:hypothetical protein [Acinetobacter piscicola]|uniref:hypothetical protein n=1 Tax=Acinetobacter piscicola TaxID=2006115 RepID=UPI000B7E7A7D|nr:hypothetical protein [Acinetobacter piscicola]